MIAIAQTGLASPQPTGVAKNRLRILSAATQLRLPALDILKCQSPSQNMSDPENFSQESANSSFGKFDALRIHNFLVFFIYIIAALITAAIMRLPETQASLISLISAGAIFATFGSAISTVGSLWERDLLERVTLNIDILYRDILHQEVPWRRWPFLRRSGKRHLLNKSITQATLSNPEVPLDVGTHVIRIALPTVLEDFFDLPLHRNFGLLRKFRAAAGTSFVRRKKGKVSQETNMERSDEYMAYECLYDTWRSILSFRLARYATHFGAGLTISGALVTAAYATARAA